MLTYTGDIRATLFVPSDDQPDISSHLDQIPRFLFRTHSPKSSGKTTPSFVQSTGSSHRYVDVLHQNKIFAKAMIERHLTIWTPSKEDNFMSWTSSLLFALQHAIRREATDFNPESATEHVKISILDTSKVPRETFMPAVALLEAYNIPSCGKLRHDYYQGEYLSQGRLDIPEGAMETTTLESLQRHGLFDFFPQFSDEEEKKRLCNRVRDLRLPFWYPNEDDRDQACSIELIGLASTIANGCCVDPRFRLVLFTSLLSLEPRAPDDSRILRKFDHLRWGKR